MAHVTYTGDVEQKGAVPKDTQVAVEQIGGEDYQLIKLIDPAPGSVTPIGTATNPLRTNPTGATVQPVSEAQPAVATVTATAVSTSTGAQQLLAASTGRLGAAIFNDIPSGMLYVKLGGAPTTGLYSFKLPPSTLYELPPPIYTGSISALWTTTSTAGAVMATELT